MLKLYDIVSALDAGKSFALKANEGRKSILNEVPFQEKFRSLQERTMEGTTFGISIDSRTLKKGEVFIALKGKNFDGHSFLDEAFRKGAVAAIVSREKKALLTKKRPYVLIGVDDTKKALERLAFSLREKFKGKVIAVTGSNGKTTTKEMIAHVLSSKFKVLKNKGTQNNEIGVPLTIFKLKNSHQIIVFELGASRSGEIFFLKEMTKPDLGVITNIGQTHLEFLKTKENVLATKLELLREKSHRVKTAFLNFSDENLRGAAISLKGQVISFGTEKDCRYRASNVSLSDEGISFLVNARHKIKLKTIGEHNIYNALAAWAVASHLGVAARDIQERLATFTFPPNRLQFMKIKDLFVIDDSYNANPQSVKAAFKALSSLRQAQNRIACLADMCELGEASEQLHYEIGFEAGCLGIDAVISFGRFSEFVTRGAKKGGVKNCVSKKNKNEVLQWLLNNVKPKGAVLFEGSRAMKMEEVVRCFINSYTS